MFSIENLLRERYPSFCNKPPLLIRPLLRALRLIFHEREFLQFAATYPHLRGYDFAEQVLDYFEFSFTVRDKERERIPAQGRVVIVSNHPIGSLDGLALIKLARTVRPDVRVVANEILAAIEPLSPLLLPVDNMGGRTPRRNLEAIQRHLNNEGALIIFPAGEVSRFGAKGVRDGKWRTGFLRLANACNAPIVPVFIDGRNSAFFYALSFLAKPLSTLWLVREMFKQARNCVEIRIGQPVSCRGYQRLTMPLQEKSELFRRHVYRIGRNREGILSTEAAIAHPENRALLREEILGCKPLGSTDDHKLICLYHYQSDSYIMREIGRLREVAFRAVGEGTGRRRDTDSYDRDYFHIILWDDSAMEIAGAYRLCDTKQIVPSRGPEALYSATLFDYQDAMSPYFERGLELGRSFVQPQYWGRRSLDYLWLGIGALLRANPQYRYLFGPVSISNCYPKEAVEMMIHFYTVHFPCRENLAQPLLPYQIPPKRQAELRERFPGLDYRSEFSRLKTHLTHMGLSVPTLYKQYSEICQRGGVQFAGFNIDPGFADCIDGLIMVDLDLLTPRKRERYIG